MLRQFLRLMDDMMCGVGALQVKVSPAIIVQKVYLSQPSGTASRNCYDPLVIDRKQ